jgi:hypothetical protein
MNRFLIFLLLALLCLPIISAVEPTQQFNKIFLDPFYRASMSLNTNYNYTIIVNPPDKISSVKSAIVTFKAYIAPTVTFNLTVNGQSCNNPLYTVSTTYSTTGQGEITFDCSNRITKSGTYNLVLRPTQANTGAITGWLDITYMNNPTGTLDISGTEYSPGDPATSFVQLRDAGGNAVTNASCYMDIWWPLNASGVHPYTIQDAPMIKALGDDGVWYYDIIAPSILGVYMESVKCSYAKQDNWVYFDPDPGPTRSATTGTWTGSVSDLDSKEDSLYERCVSTTGGTRTCEASYDFNLTIHNLGGVNFTSLDLYYSGESTQVATSVWAIWNWTSSTWTNLPNNLVWIAGSSTTSPIGVNQYQSNTLPLSSQYVSNGVVRIRMTTTGASSFNLWNNWLNINVVTATGAIQELKGSSEMHVTNIANATLAGINKTEIAGYVWNYTPDRYLTYERDTTNYTLVQNYVWNATNRSLTYYNMTDTTNYTKIDASIAAINQSLSSLVTGVPANVWNYTTRNLTYYLAVDYAAIWNYTNRNLTYYPDMTNYTQVANSVWNNAIRTLTSFDWLSLQGYVWNATTRELTGPDRITIT